MVTIFFEAVLKNLIGVFLGQKRALAAPLELAQQHEQHENVVFLVSSHDGNEEIGGCAQKIDFATKARMLGLPASVKAPALAATGGCAVAQLIAPCFRPSVQHVLGVLE